MNKTQYPDSFQNIKCVSRLYLKDDSIRKILRITNVIEDMDYNKY